jgi:hypothetical protein
LGRRKRGARRTRQFNVMKLRISYQESFDSLVDMGSLPPFMRWHQLPQSFALLY